MTLFGSSGTRGVATRKVGPEFAARLAAAAATVWDADRVALARDTRTTGGLLADAAAAGLAGAGATVERLGVLPTPGAQTHADREGVPALVVTASHNPPEYNGLKLVEADGVEATLGTLRAVEEVFEAESHDRAAWDAVGARFRVDGAGESYVEGIVDAVDRSAIGAADLTVALDPGHGSGCETTPDLLRRLGCRVLTVNAQPDGHFPGRDPEPVPEHLADLRRLVRASDADLGVAHDGDADRAIFVDESGEQVSGDASFAALAAADLAPGDTLVSAVNVSGRVVDAVEAAGAALSLTPIGSTHIVSRVRELRDGGVPVPVAGEGNGGVAFPPYRLARDGAYTAARFLELVADAPASEVVAPHGGYRAERRAIEHGGDPAPLLAAVQDAAERAADGEGPLAADAPPDLTTIDGYRLDYDGAWVLARASGTEPVVRVVGEARDPDRAASLVERMADVARDA
ncbi:MAG: phosphoglucosamine mutase [Halobacteriaceae archaeon]